MASETTESKAREIAREIVIPTMDAIAKRGDPGATHLVYDLIARVAAALDAHGRAEREAARSAGLVEGAQIAHEYAKALNVRGQRLLKEGFHNQQILDQQAGASGAAHTIEHALAQRPGAEEK